MRRKGRASDIYVNGVGPIRSQRVAASFLSKSPSNEICDALWSAAVRGGYKRSQDCAPAMVIGSNPFALYHSLLAGAQEPPDRQANYTNS
jgi:hypothetical protein